MHGPAVTTQYRFWADPAGADDPRWRRLTAAVRTGVGEGLGEVQPYTEFRAEWADRSRDDGLQWLTVRNFDRLPGLLASVALGDHLAGLALSDLLQEVGAPEWVWQAMRGDADWWAELPPRPPALMPSGAVIGLVGGVTGMLLPYVGPPYLRAEVPTFDVTDGRATLYVNGARVEGAVSVGELDEGENFPESGSGGDEG